MMLLFCESISKGFKGFRVIDRTQFAQFTKPWLVGYSGFNGPLSQYLSLYRAVSQREGEREQKGQMRVKLSK